MSSRSGSARIERAIERYLESLAARQPADVETLAAELDTSERGRFRAEALAEGYLARTANGEALSVEQELARLADDAERRIFAQVIEDARAAGRALPGELLPGAVLEKRYEIRRWVGGGGMGSVYAALDRDLEREVAIKVLRLPGGSAGAEWEELFRNESLTLARLHSKHIVAVHDVRRGPPHSYIVMDLVQGEDMQRVLSRTREQRAETGAAASSPEPLRRALGRAPHGERADLLGERTHARCVARIMHSIARAIEGAHAAGVVHRDLKPQNIMLVPGGEPVLLDFGLASGRTVGMDAGFRGTPEFLAPEQIENMSAGTDPRTDVFQLGLVLYEMLSLQRAYSRKKGEGLQALFARIVAGQCQPLREVAPEVPATLAAIVAKAMQKDPRERYASARELREDLERFLRRLPPRHAGVSLALAAGLRVAYVARHPLALTAVALALVAYFATRATPRAAPTLVAFTQDMEPGAPLVRVRMGLPLEIDDPCVLGVTVSAPQPTCLYAFSIFGAEQAEGRLFLRPLEPELFSGEHAGSPTLSGLLELPAGTHEILCTKLARPEPYEGLQVYTCAKRSKALELWQETLREWERNDGPIPYPKAQKLLEDLLLARTRGESLATLSAEERTVLFGEVRAPAEEGESSWRALGLERYDMLFQITLP